MFLIVAVIFALGVAYFATQNTGVVTLHLGQSIFPAVPLYMVMVISLLIGMFLAWVTSLFDSIGSLFALRGKDASLRSSRNQLNTMEKRIHDLELENAQLRGENSEEEIVQPVVTEEAEIAPRRNPLFPNFRSMFR